MTDYRSIEDLWVIKDGIKVATLARVHKGCHFRYTEEFLRSERAAIALHLPKTSDGILVEGIVNLPTYFAGLLPEGVMFRAIQTQIGTAADDLFAMLAATGSDTVGDIDVQVPGLENTHKALNLQDAREMIRSLLEEGKPPGEPISAIPGVQPKLSVGQLVRSSRNSRYIVKFDPPEYPNLSQNEHAIMTLARRCGLDVARTRLSDQALIVTRFDRVYDPKARKMKRIHVEDMLQVMDQFPNRKYSMEFSELMGAIRNLGAPKASLLAALRLYIFSYIVGNGDLHAKNVSVVFDREVGQWSLSPGYDLLSSLPYGESRMALALHDDAFGRFTVSEFFEIGREFGLTEKAVRGMIENTRTSVGRYAPDLLRGVLTPEIIETILDRASSLRTEVAK